MMPEYSCLRLSAACKAQALLRMMLSLALCMVLLIPAASAQSPTREELWSETLRTVREHFPHVHQLSTDDLAKMLESRSDITILDTRELEEFEVSHIEGAFLAQNARAAIELLEDQDLDDPVVVYCSVGYRSSRIAAILSRRGFSNVFNLEGSLFKWANENRPIYRGDEKATKVHPYNESWGRLLEQNLLPE